MIEIFIYAFWCWLSYGFLMGSFMYVKKGTTHNITITHVILTMIVSAFGWWSFLIVICRSFLLHGKALPISWNMSTGTVR